MRALLLALALAMPAHAQAPIHAVIDCGTLSGVGIVRVIIGDQVLRVNVDCGKSV